MWADVCKKSGGGRVRSTRRRTITQVASQVEGRPGQAKAKMKARQRDVHAVAPLPRPVDGRLTLLFLAALLRRFLGRFFRGLLGSLRALLGGLLVRLLRALFRGGLLGRFLHGLR